MQEGADPNLANGTGVAPIHEGMAMQINWRDLINVALAARLGSIGILQILLDASAYIDQQDGSGWTALHCAIKYEFRSSLTLSPPSSYLYLFMLCRHDHLEAARILLDRGASM